jgi:hypothetical protein
MKTTNINALPNYYEADLLSAGSYAKRTFTKAAPSLVFIEKINMHESRELATVYWHDMNTFNGTHGQSWATTCVLKEVAMRKSWYSTITNKN